MTAQDQPLTLSGERFSAVYQLGGTHTATQAQQRALDICLEQTVEFPHHLIPSAAIRDQIVGEVAALEPLGADRWEAVIRYPVEVAGRELTQLVNCLFGNISIKPGIRLTRFDLGESLGALYRGPRFGQAGLRALLGIQDRPIVCTAIKPMGLNPRELADLAYRLALGGIDLIKDDHGLTDQRFCPFDERVQRCTAAVERANRETGGRARYLPNVTAPATEIGRRARLAQNCDAGGLLFCPGLAGLDAMRALADDDALALPILSHPAFQGSFTLHPDGGLTHGVLYGQLNRLAGADATIFPSYGGRFAFTAPECRDIVDAATGPMAGFPSIFPVPAGGMGIARVPELIRFYGRDCCLLIGGDLHAQGADLVANCRGFLAAVRKASEE
ncbi:RuBisCO large subunit C-terminal-like domain-containing protein [uncultured Thiodictyon sp.]|uniref:RuBisCO large subunit C-terminal-like domain-containing protein n=1 Tax=uncultured Thiodictyon sp. TaxID=1846217 RepID=UPI0025D546B3|nr:RuBisCO large subunit C-terminal-like domain-containing protein [uncultured Thiodictyon sp.]